MDETVTGLILNQNFQRLVLLFQNIIIIKTMVSYQDLKNSPAEGLNTVQHLPRYCPPVKHDFIGCL